MARSVRALIGLAATLVLATMGVAPASATATAIVLTNPGHQDWTWFVDIQPIQMQASGGVPPYTWSKSGITRAISIDPTTGLIDGLPIGNSMKSGRATITAVDALGNSGSTTFTWTVSGGCGPGC